MKRVVCGIVITDHRLLLCLDKGLWVIPGGKQEEEDDIGTLCREFHEEFSGTKIIVGEQYCTLRGNDFHNGTSIEIAYYFVSVNGELGEPSHEIQKAEFTNTFKDRKMSPQGMEVVHRLIEEGYVHG